MSKETCSLKTQQSVDLQGHQQSSLSFSEGDGHGAERNLQKTDSQALLAPPPGHGQRSRAESGGQRAEVKGHRAEHSHRGHPDPKSDDRGHRVDHGSHKGQQGSRPESGGQKSQTASASDDQRMYSGRNQKQTKLLESCFVLKVEEFTIFQVSVPNNRKGSVKKFLCSDKKQLHLPPEMSVVQLEFTEYFFTEGIDYPGKG